jgi:hypothetical protein
MARMAGRRMFLKLVVEVVCTRLTSFPESIHLIPIAEIIA